MYAAVLTLALLSGAPVDAPRSAPRLVWRFSIGSFMGSVWASEAFRQKVNNLRDEAMGGLQNHDSPFDSQYVWFTTPVVGPWLTIIKGGQQARDDMWILITSGVLQGVGLSALTYRLLTQQNLPPPPSRTQELELSISPYVAGRLGLAVTLSGF